MDKETLSQYGWVVICIIVIAIMIVLATPFGEYIKESIANATKALFGAAQDALGNADVVVEDPTTTF